MYTEYTEYSVDSHLPKTKILTSLASDSPILVYSPSLLCIHCIYRLTPI